MASQRAAPCTFPTPRRCETQATAPNAFSSPKPQAIATLKVDAFAGGIIGNHDPHDRIGIEGRNRCTSGLTRNAAMNDDHSG